MGYLEKVRPFYNGLIPFLLALQSFLGGLQLLDSLGLEVNVVVHRMWELRGVELGVDLAVPLLFLLLLWAVWLTLKLEYGALVFPLFSVLFFPLGLEVVVSVASLLAVGAGLWYGRQLRGYLFWLLAVLGVFEAAALLHWVVFVPLGLANPFEKVAMLDLTLFYLASFLAPLMGLTLVFICLLKPLVQIVGGEEINLESSGVGTDPVISRRDLLFLSLVVSLSVLAAFYPYLPSVNPRGIDVGVDIRAYVGTAEVVEGDVLQAFNVTGGSRPLIFLAIFGFQKLTGFDVLTAVRFLPVVLNPLLALSVFFFALEISGDGSMASWAAFFTICGYPISVGMYSYFLTNMLGLTLALTSLGLLFRSLRCNSRACLFAASVLGALLVFTHPWTFNQYSAGAVLTTVVLWYYTRKKESHPEVMTMLSYVVALGIAEVLKTLVFGGLGGVAATTTALNRLTSVSNFWSSLEFCFKILYSGLMSVLVLFGLAIGGVLSLRLRNTKELYLWIFMAATSLVFLFGDEVIKSRLLYNVPIGLFAALGLSLISSPEWSRESLVLKSFISLNMIVSLFRGLANLI